MHNYLIGQKRGKRDVGFGSCKGKPHRGDEACHSSLRCSGALPHTYSNFTFPTESLSRACKQIADP